MKYTALLFILIFGSIATAQEKPIGGTHFFTELAPNIYMVESKFGGANSTIIITDEGVIVVDSQNSPAKAQVLIDEIARLTDKKITTVINSHWHGDHHGGNTAFLKANPNVEIIAHPNTFRDIETLSNEEIQLTKSFKSRGLEPAKKIVEQENSESSFTSEQIAQIKKYIPLEESYIKSLTDDYKYMLPNKLLRNRKTTLKSGKTEIELHHPGKAHTEGDLYVYLPKEKILITGDLLTVPYVVPRSGFPKAYSKVLKKMATIKFEKLVPGHGKVLTDNKLLLLMADFLIDTHLLAKSHIKSGINEKDGVEAAKNSERLKKYKQLINWNEERGLRFLNYESLIEMTYSIARREESEAD